MSARGRGGVILDSIMSSRVKNWFKVRFIAGFFFTVPVFLTAWLLWIFWSRIDDVFAPMFDKIFGRAEPRHGAAEYLVEHRGEHVVDAARYSAAPCRGSAS